jgi:hypothetical protein
MREKKDAPKLREATDFIEAELRAKGAVAAADILDTAVAKGMSKITLHRAAKAMGIVIKRREGVAHGGWTWSLPPDYFGRDFKGDPVDVEGTGAQSAPNPRTGRHRCRYIRGDWKSLGLGVYSLTRKSWVRFRRQTGRHLLVGSLSAFDRTRTLPRG